MGAKILQFSSLLSKMLVTRARTCPKGFLPSHKDAHLLPLPYLLFGAIMMDIQLILKVVVLDFLASMKLWINQLTLVVDS